VIGIALLLVITGVFLEDYAVQLIGLSFLFISGSLMMAGSIEYKTGENNSMVYVYGDNYTSYHWDYATDPPVCNPSNPLECVELFHTEKTTIYNYNNFDDSTSQWVGIYLMVLSMLASAVIFTRLKAEKDEDL